MDAAFVTRWDDVADCDLVDAITHRDAAAFGEVYRRYGADAFNVAAAITQDARRAEQAVVTAFVGLAAAGANGRTRPLRAELLDATRRAASDLAVEASGDAPLHAVGPGDVFRALPLEHRSALALALMGRCGVSEIAQIMRRDTAVVRGTLLAALDHARELLANPPPDGAARSALTPQ